MAIPRKCANLDLWHAKPDGHAEGKDGNKEGHSVPLVILRHDSRPNGLYGRDLVGPPCSTAKNRRLSLPSARRRTGVGLVEYVNDDFPPPLRMAGLFLFFIDVQR